MSKIRYIAPKADIYDVRKCDSCGAVPVAYSKDFVHYVCSYCQSRISECLVKAGLLEKGYWREYTPTYDIPEKPHYVYRPRKRHERLRLAACERAEQNSALRAKQKTPAKPVL